MYEVIGQTSKKIYTKGKYRCDCLRELQRKYPYHKGKKRHLLNKAVYSEPLLIRRVGRK